MKQVSVRLVNYSADLYGVCSALYELGGLIVMHDASGCNSTYATHDEPRWYDIDSMIYISGITEFDAIMGDDDKLIRDIVTVAEEKHPRFIAVFGSPVATMIGTDFRGIAHLIQEKTGIPTFAFRTSGMKTYVHGANQAYLRWAQEFLPAPEKKDRSVHEPVRVNLLGVTPLDFSIVGNVEALRRFASSDGLDLVSVWSMGDKPEVLEKAPEADVNLLCSSVAIDLAEWMEETYGIPYVEGLPIGSRAQETVRALLQCAAEDGKSRILGMGDADSAAEKTGGSDDTAELPEGAARPADVRALVIGEPVFAGSLRYALEELVPELSVSLICPTERSAGMLRKNDPMTYREEEIKEAVDKADLVIADPVYRRLLPEDSGTAFVRFPHEAYSGRMYREEIPVFIGGSFDDWLLKLKKELIEVTQHESY
ncbi:MAG: nitrogenase component 1 [Anaerovoracaceae bacterium]|jgi:nitrogenase molybdenum-cofactor synthesis protein NifE